MKVLILVIMGISVAVADAFLKKAANDSASLRHGLSHWLIPPSIVLYTIQMILFVYMFRERWELGRLCIMQMVSYTICVMLIGWLYFGDTIQPVHIAGTALALIGIMLINQ